MHIQKATLACLEAGKVSYGPRSLCVPLTFIRLDNVDSVGDHAIVVITKVANRAMNVA